MKPEWQKSPDLHHVTTRTCNDVHCRRSGLSRHDALKNLSGLVREALSGDTSNLIKKRVLAALVASITVLPDKSVDIILNVPKPGTDHHLTEHAGPASGPGVRMETALVEVRGFEPRTPCMPCKCSTS